LARSIRGGRLPEGQRPSIYTSSERLRNVRMSTINPTTAMFSSDSWTAKDDVADARQRLPRDVSFAGR
jgi:hypothetical protein